MLVLLYIMLRKKAWNKLLHYFFPMEVCYIYLHVRTLLMSYILVNKGCTNKFLSGLCLLVDVSANALVRNDDCQTPLDVARLNGHTNVVRTLEVCSRNVEVEYAMFFMYK